MANTFTVRPSRGLSAYQVAVAQGFAGTEAAWIAALRGIDPTRVITHTGPFAFDWTSEAAAMLRLLVTTEAIVTLPADAPVGAGFMLLQAGVGRALFAPAAGAEMHNDLGHTRSFARWSIAGAFVESNPGGLAASWVLYGATNP